jgi:hypothetical protein
MDSGTENWRPKWSDNRARGWPVGSWCREQWTGARRASYCNLRDSWCDGAMGSASSGNNGSDTMLISRLMGLRPQAAESDSYQKAMAVLASATMRSTAVRIVCGSPQKEVCVSEPRIISAAAMTRSLKAASLDVAPFRGLWFGGLLANLAYTQCLRQSTASTRWTDFKLGRVGDKSLAVRPNLKGCGVREKSS